MPVIHDITVFALLFLQESHIHEGHPQGIETEEENVTGESQRGRGRQQDMAQPGNLIDSDGAFVGTHLSSIDIVKQILVTAGRLHLKE